MPPLNNLSLEQLQQLTQYLAEIEDAGRLLHAAGLEPVFDLTPGAPICIFTNAVTPGAPEVEPEVRITKTRVDVQIRDERTSFLKPRSTEAPSDAPDAEPVDPPPAFGEVAGGGPISAEPSRAAEARDVPQDAAKAGASAESGGGPEVAAPETPAAPVPRSASAMAATSQFPLWTKDEDARLVDLIVDGVTNRGLTKKAAAIEASRAIGRPEPGTLYRVNHKLRDLIDAAINVAAMEQAQTETPEIPPAEDAGASVSRDAAAAGGHSPAAVQEIDASALDAAFERQVDAMPDLHGEDLRVWQWIAAHRAKWPHTASTDLDLAVALGRGEKINLVAMDLGIDVRALQDRWNVLSKPIRNSQDKITIDGMPRLITILRRIAKAPAAAA